MDFINRTLVDLGVPTHLKGFKFIHDAIEIASEDDSILDCMVKELYPEIANKSKSTPKRVERAIRHAIEVTFYQGDRDVLYQFFGNTVISRSGKPTNKQFVTMFLLNCSEEIKQERNSNND